MAENIIKINDLYYSADSLKVENITEIKLSKPYNKDLIIKVLNRENVEIKYITDAILIAYELNMKNYATGLINIFIDKICMNTMVIYEYDVYSCWFGIEYIQKCVGRLRIGYDGFYIAYNNIIPKWRDMNHNIDIKTKVIMSKEKADAILAIIDALDPPSKYYRKLMVYFASDYQDLYRAQILRLLPEHKN